MASETQQNRWVVHPSLWFDAVCLVPLLAGMPFRAVRPVLPAVLTGPRELTGNR